jgi:hypothetical protein
MEGRFYALGQKMGFQIVRVAKVKTAGGMRAGLDHLFRERETFNADKTKLEENTTIGSVKTSAEAILRFNGTLPDKYRKDAVLGLEYLITASPEVMASWDRSKQDDFLQKGLEWVVSRHGEQNVIAGSIHRDETTPHLSVFVVPKVAEKLNAKAFTGGKAVLSQMQDNFHEKVGQRFELERGLKNSKAKHQSIGKFYGLVSETPPEPSKDELRMKNNRLVGLPPVRFEVQKSPLSANFDPDGFAQSQVRQALKEADGFYSKIIKEKEKVIENLQPKASSYELLRRVEIREKQREKKNVERKKELDIREGSLNQNQKYQDQIINKAREIGRAEGFKNGEKSAVKQLEILRNDIQEAHATNRSLIEYRSTLTAERDDLHEQLQAEKTAHQETKKAFKDFLKSVALAMPERLRELQTWAKKQLGLDKPKDLGIGR